MANEGIGNKLNGLIRNTMSSLFDQGELAQLTYSAFSVAAQFVKDSSEEDLTVQFPIGYTADKQTVEGKRVYKKEDLHRRYEFLARRQLPENGIINLITTMDALLGDLIRTVVLQYPKKIGGKRTLTLRAILEAKSIEEVHLRAADSLLNEMTYKSPLEFAHTAEEILSINLLECPAYHKYIELKATRDIVVHNRGVANEIYIRKAASHARVSSGDVVPVTESYYLESYEACLQLTEWLETQLHQHWHSSDFETRQSQTALQLEGSTAQLQIPAKPEGDEASGGDV
jgi:hypothetical protein